MPPLAAMSWAVVLLAASALASPTGTRPHESRNVKNDCGFVTVKDGGFYRDGKPYYLSSMNYWSSMNLAASGGAGGNLSRFETEVKQLHKVGVNNVRIMASSEVSQNGIQPFRMYPALMKSPGVYNEEIFRGLDRSLATFRKYDMTVVMTLANFWHWSGGAGQYVSWATKSSIPYPPSWDPTLNAPYGNYTINGTWGEYYPQNNTWDGYTGYAGRFYNDSSITNQTQRWYRDHIKTVVNRVNTITGVRYKDDPTISTWELMNEPQVPPVSWVKGTADYIKQLAPKQLVTVGFEGKDGEVLFKRTHGPKSVDYATAHVWPVNRGWFNMSDPSDENFGYAIGNSTDVLNNVTQWSLDLGKPVILEEFGFSRDNWENVAKGAPTSFYFYDAGASTSRKDQFYQFMIGFVVEKWKKGKAWSGAGPWAYGGIWRPTDRRNAYNELWAGDPPHEAPGWYDVYDKDKSTLAIITAQARNTTAFIEAGHKH